MQSSPFSSTPTQLSTSPPIVQVRGLTIGFGDVILSRTRASTSARRHLRHPRQERLGQDRRFSAISSGSRRRRPARSSIAGVGQADARGRSAAVRRHVSVGRALRLDDRRRERCLAARGMDPFSAGRGRRNRLGEAAHRRAQGARKFPSELSGGMKNRAAIARAMALEPAFSFSTSPPRGSIR